MARSRSRKSSTRADAPAPQETSLDVQASITDPAAGLASRLDGDPHGDFAEMAEDLQVLHDAALRPISWPKMLREGERLEAWLEDRGCSAEAFRAAAVKDHFGVAKVPPVLLVAYLAHTVEVRNLSKSSLQATLSTLLGWFRAYGWATPDLRVDAAARDEYAIVRHFLASHRYDDPERATKVRARPADRLEVIEAISVEIERSRNITGTAPEWVDAIKTLHLFICNVGFRTGETVNHLRWSWLEFTPDELLIHVPDDTLKNHPSARTLRVPCPDRGQPCRRTNLCALHQILRWRGSCERVGIPTGPNDLVFPYVREQLSTAPADTAPVLPAPGGGGTGRKTLPAIHVGSRAWVADPVEEKMAIARGWGRTPDELAKIEADAKGNHYHRYATPWKRFAEAAGFVARHRFERVSSYSGRRGVATRFHRNGASLAHVAFQLCQSNTESASVYVDQTEDETPDFAPLYDLDGLDRDDDLSLIDVLDLSEIVPVGQSCDATTSSSRCPHASAGTVTFDGVLTGLCEGHLRRFFRGVTDFASMRPIPPADLSIASRTCELVLASGCCGRRRASVGVLEGSWLALCATHYNRYVAGLGLDGIKEEMRPPLEARCRVTHQGHACDRDAIGQHAVDGQWLSMCNSHKQRWSAGKRDDSFTMPIRAAAPRISSPTCDVHHHGVSCARPSKGSLVVEGQRLSLCGAHFIRWRSGKRDEAFTEPIRAQQRLDPSCEVSHRGQRCGQQTRYFLDVGDEVLSVCSAHEARWRTGKRDDEFTGPVRTKRKERLQRFCGVVHDNTACGRKAEGGIEIEGELLSACKSHYLRWHAGKRDDEFTAPIRKRTKREGLPPTP